MTDTRGAALLFCLLSCLFHIVSPSNAFAQEQERYIWPIDAPQYISATFGEYRPGRFHLGVDFKSGGVNGKKVYSLGDGYIAHVRTTPFGYGKALYINLDNGKTVVYGHLSRYTNEVEEALYQVRIQKGSYDVDWYPEKNKYRVKKGDLVAYSGDTGSGAPHLHLEIRDENNVGENPLKYGFDVKDSVPPVITRVAVIPLDGESSVDGLPVPRWFAAGECPATPVVLSGSIGIAISTFDRADTADNRLGVYTEVLTVDSKELFSKVYDGIAYDVTYYGAFNYMPGLLFGGGGYISPLFRQTGNILKNFRGSGVLTESVCGQGKTCTLTAAVTDYFGNTKSISFPVVFEKRPFITACERSERGGLHIAGRHLAGTVKSVTISRVESGGADTFIEKIDIGSDVFDIRTDAVSNAGTYRVSLSSDNGVESMPVTVAVRQGGNGGGHPLSVDTQLFHDRVFVRVTARELLGSLPVLRVFRDGESDGTIVCPIQENARSWVTSVPITGRGKRYVYVEAHAVAADGSAVRGTAETGFYASDRRRELTIISEDSLFTMRVAPESLYRPAPFAISERSARGDNGLTPISKAYHVNCGDYPVKGSFDVSIASNERYPSNAALFTSGNGSGGWRFASSGTSGNAMTGRLAGSGSIAVLVDSEQPYCAAASPTPGRSTNNSRPTICARLSDRGSGIAGSDSIVMSIDGIRVYGEYDSISSRISYRPHNPLKAGSHSVEVTVTDRCGNSKTVSWTFNVVK